MYRLFFKGTVIFYRLRGGVEDFGRTHGSSGGTGRGRDHLCVSTLSFRGFPCDYFFCFHWLFMARDDVKLCCDWLWCFPFV